MAEDLRRQRRLSDALAGRLDYQESLRRPPCCQKALLNGMDCLAGQQDLICDGRPAGYDEGIRGRLGRSGPECLSPGDSGEGRWRPLFGSENG